MKDYLRRAVEAVAGPHNRNWSEGVEYLDKLGLLMTPEAEACVKACEDREAVGDEYLRMTDDACRRAGRASLAAKRPKERWRVWWTEVAVGKRGNVGVRDLTTMEWHAYPTEAHARAAAAALNAVDKRGG
jgi:hypothetical protein